MPLIDLKLKLNAGWILVFGPLQSLRSATSIEMLIYQ